MSNYPRKKMGRYVMAGFILTGFLLFSVHKVSAENPATSPFQMTEHDLQYGRTISDATNTFLLGIGPNVLDQESLVTIETWDLTTTPLPEGLQAVSQSFVYDIKMPRPKIFPKNRPLIIRLNYQSDNQFQKKLYHWDNNIKRWQPLPTKLYSKEKYLTASVHFPYTPIIALENPAISELPIKTGGESPPVLSAQAAVVMDSRTKTILYEKNKDQTWWPASITKLLSAIVFLQNKPDFSQVITYQDRFQSTGGQLRIKAGETMTVKNTFYTTLVGSANNTANMLPSIISRTDEAFLQRMNEVALTLGMNRSHFADVSGLSTDNRSTANDLAILTEEASRFWQIFQASNTRGYSFTTGIGEKFHTIKNTNALLGKTDYHFLVGKTGYLDESKYNNVVKVKNKAGDELVIVVLGAPSSAARFTETDKLARYIWKNYEWGKASID